MSVSEYQKLYNQAMEAYKKNKSRVSTAAKNTSKTTTTKSTSNKKENVLTKKNNSVTKEDAERILANSSNINKQVSSMGVAQPDYENERFSKSQADKIIEEGQQALKERESAFNKWYTEDKKDMLFNADGTYRDLRAELDDFKAKSNTWQMTAKERHEYNAYKKELETAIEHSDYLQSRDKEKTLSTAEEKKDFYLMQDAYNDTFGEKALKKLSKVTGTIANMPFQAFDVVNDFVNPNFDINNPNNVSNVIYDALNKSEEQIQYGSGDVEQFALNSLEGVADFGAHFLLGMATGVSPIISMGAKSGLSKYSQNRKEGYDEMTSLGNAVLTGTMTLLTEKIGVDNFTNIITSGLGQFSIGALVSQSLGEGLEEGIEYLTEPLIDFATLGKNVDYKAGELFMSVALGMSSGAILGATGNTISAVKTRKTANQLKADMQVLTDYANKNTLNNTEASVINQALRLGNNALAKFENASVIGDAIQFESDKVKKMSMEEIRQNLYAFMQPQIDAERNTYNERMAVHNIINNAQQVLNNKGIRMDALQYSNLDEDVKKQVDTLQGLARDLKQDVVFNSELNVDGVIIDGFYDNETGRIVINPNGNNPAMSTFVHELTHGTESSKTYNRLKELVKSSDKDFDKNVQNTKELYKSVTDLTDEGASQEYVAIYLQEMLGNEEFVKRLVKYDTSLASRIYEGVKKVVFNTKTSQDIEYAFMKAFRDSGISEQALLQYSFKDAKGKDIVLDENKELENAKKVLEMAPVYSIQENKFAKNSNKNLVEMASDYFASFGNIVFRDDIGEIVLDERGAKSLIAHYPRYQDKYAAIEALPTVIEKGEIINSSENWKGRNKDTIVICAPVSINNKTKYMSVVVEQDEFLDNKYYVHELIILDQEYKKNSANSLNKTQSFSGTELTEFTYNILKKAKNNKYSIGLSSQDVKGRTLSKQQQEYFKNSKARDEDGNLKVYYHGTSRADRVGTVFDPERATSGPMAYFTDNERIAGNYARDKKDTSIAYDERYDSYYTQFRINHNGEDISVTDYWNTLPLSKRREITEKAKHITMDDDWENVIYDEAVNNGLGNMDQYLLREHNGNAISALISSWIEDGNIYGEESKFLDVLNLIGIEDAQYLDPDYRDEKVYEVYLNITNPLDTSELDMDFADDLEYWINNNDMAPYQKESSGADTWDKNNWNLNEWVDRLRDDIESETTHVWTSIPDAVTAYLKEQGYDGISDTGGKNGGETHQVVIPFYSNQVKNVNNIEPTINKDIRYSVGLSMENIKNNKPLEDLKTKYSDLNPTLIDKAVEEVQRQGYVSEVTKGALKDELKTFFGDEHIFENNPKARNRINEFINETIEEFATKIRYESDDKYANSVASKTNKILKGYENATSEDIENLYDNVSTIKNADALLKERRDLRLLDHTNLVEMLLFKGKDTKGYMSQLERVLDKIADGDVELRNELREKIEYPRFQAQIQYKELLEKYNTTVKEIVSSGIREGSKESKAVQWIMEKQREDGSPYTNADLLKEFGYKMKNGKMAYENIENAAKLLRRDYDEIYNLINNIRESIYGDVELRNQLETEELQAKVKLAEETKNAAKLALEKNPSEQTQRVFAAANNDFNRLNRQLEAKRKDDASGDSTRRQKLKHRDNYAHHTFERESIILNLIKGYAGVKEVPTKLAGVSDYAQPKTGYASFFKKRLDGKYEADALKGFAEYMQDASRIIAYDPLIEYYRDFLSVMRNTAQDDNMSQFTRYMTNYVNALAGKTVTVDRWVRENLGDKLYGVLKEINSRVKANAILGNLRTAVTQFANAPMAAGMLVKNGGAGAVQDLTKGAFNYLTSIFTGKGDNSYLSPFVQVRTFDVDTNAIGVRAKVDEMFNFLLSKGDEIVTKMIWNAAYEQGKRKGVDSPVFYADDLTRRTVAGRSVGEVPLNLQSQVMNFIMPFQVETTNTMNNFIDMAKDPKSWGALLVTLIADFFFNELFEEMTGSRPLFDPIDVIRDAIKNEEDIATTSRHMLGEVAGATPYGSMIPAFTGMDSYDTKKWFGDNDPSRYGTGNIGASAITNIFTSVIEGKPLDAISDTVANFVLPGGGKQLQRSVETLQTNGILPQYVNGEWVFSPAYHKSNGDVAYETVPEQILDNASNLGNFAKQVAFGKWAGNEAQEYLNGSSSSQTSSKAQKIIDWFTSKDETVSKNDAVSITEEIEQARDSFTSSKTKGEFIEWMEGKDYSSEQKNMIFDTYYGDSKQIMNLNNFATSTGLSTSQTYDVKKNILTAEGKKTANKIDTITNSKALEVRKKLDEIGLYDEYLNYVLDNDLELSSMGLNKKVAKMTNEEFESEYSNIFGTSYKTKTDEKSLSDIYAEVMSATKTKKSSSSKKSDNTADKIKKIDNIVNKAINASISSSDSKVDEILKKLKNTSSNNSTAKATNSELLKRYLKEHAYDTALFD